MGRAARARPRGSPPPTGARPAGPALPFVAVSGVAGAAASVDAQGGRFDLAAAQDVTIAPGQIALVPTGLVIEVPTGHCLAIFARSSTPLKRGLMVANGVGIIDPDYFLGGRKSLNKDNALKAIEAKIARPLKVTVREAAAGIYDIVNAKMSDLIRRQVVRTGYLPEEFVIYAFGGAGPVHASGCAAELGIKNVYIFATSPVFSAFGVGLLGNAVLPARAGELARVAVLRRHVAHGPGTSATLLGTVFAHRLFDLFPIGLLVAYVLATAKIPPWAVTGIAIVGLVGLALLTVAIISARRSDRPRDRGARGAFAAINALDAGRT